MIQRRAIVGIVSAACVALLAGCGFQAPVVQDSEHASVQATDFHVGLIQVQDTSITQAATASGTPRFYLIATIVNDGTQPDLLTGVTLGQGTRQGTSLGKIVLGGPGTVVGRLPIPPGVPVEIGLPGPGSVVSNLTVVVTPQPQVGSFLPVIFTFAKAGPSATIQVPIIPPGETTAPTQAVPTTQATAPTEVGDSASD